MKNKKSIYKISGILVLLVFMLGLALTGCTAQNKTAGETATPQTETATAAETTVAETTAAETQSTEQLSEQPDKAKYDEYFTEFYLGKLPRGKQVGPPDNIPVKTAVFIASEDEFCVAITLKKDIPGSFSFAVYDAVAKKDFAPKTVFPVALNVGGHAWADDPIEYPAGKYEYKLYIDDVLVAVVPFEVRAGETTTPQTETTTASTETQSTEQLSEQPDKAKYQEYFTEFYLGKAPRGQQIPQIHPGSPGLIKTAVFIASEDEFCVVGTVKKAIPSGSFYIAVYDTVAKKDFVSKTVEFTEGLNAGSFGWVDNPIEYPAGKYEYKVYIDDALVVVVPFEVR
jgi:hypothetical protein